MAAQQISHDVDIDREALPGTPTGTRHHSQHQTGLASLPAAQLSEAMVDLDFCQQVDDISVEVPSLMHSFGAKVKDETSSPMLYDVTMTSSSQHVIVTDCWNHCIKAFDVTQDGSPCVGVYRLKEECPLCITSLSSPERVVFTIHQRAELYVVNVNETAVGQSGEETGEIRGVSEDVLTFESLIDTSHKYRGISALRGQTGDNEWLVLTVPKEIHVLSGKGQILRVLAPSLCGLPLLQDAIYVTATTGGDLLVTDVGARRVLCLRLSGSLRWLHPSLQLAVDQEEGEDGEGGSCSKDFQGIQWPLGVAADEQGRVLVCDLELHSVVLLSAGGAVGRLLLTETQSLQYPRGLCISDGRLCLTQDDSIKIFSMTPDRGLNLTSEEN